MNITAGVDNINDIEVRCKNCNRKLFVGLPGLDYSGKPKIVEMKCPRCGKINMIKIEIIEKLVVVIKDDRKL